MARLKGFTQIPNWMVWDHRLKSAEFRVLVALWSHDWVRKGGTVRKGQVWPSMGRLAEMMGCTRRAVFGYLKGLEGKGYIRKLSGGGGPGRSNRYALTLIPAGDDLDAELATVNADAGTVNNDVATVNKHVGNGRTGVHTKNTKEAIRMEADELKHTNAESANDESADASLGATRPLSGMDNNIRRQDGTLLWLFPDGGLCVERWEDGRTRKVVISPGDPRYGDLLAELIAGQVKERERVAAMLSNLTSKLRGVAVGAVGSPTSDKGGGDGDGERSV